MRRLARVRRAAVVVAAAAVLGVAAPAFAQPDAAAVDAAMTAIVAKAQAPGAALAVADHGRLIVVQRVRIRGRRGAQAGGPDTMFALASCSKPITAMAVMKLVDDGKITLRTPAFAFLGMRAVADPRASAHHGRAAAEPLVRFAARRRGDDRRSDGHGARRRARAVALRARLAASVLERRFQRARRDRREGERTALRRLRARQRVPARGRHALRRARDRRRRSRARRFATQRTGASSSNKIGEGGTPAGGWILSPADMVRVLVAYDAGKIVSPASRAAMLAPPVAPLKPRANGAAFGLGWDVVYRVERRSERRVLRQERRHQRLEHVGRAPSRRHRVRRVLQRRQRHGRAPPGSRRAGARFGRPLARSERRGSSADAQLARVARVRGVRRQRERERRARVRLAVHAERNRRRARRRARRSRARAPCLRCPTRLAPRKKRSNTCGCSRSGMPGPRSRTATSTSAAPLLTSTVTGLSVAVLERVVDEVADRFVQLARIAEHQRARAR